jgi:hypothetical protein
VLPYVGPSVVLVVSVAWNAYQRRQLFAWPNFYFGLPLSNASATFLVATALDRMARLESPDLLSSLGALGSLFFVAVAGILWAGILLIQMDLRRSYERFEPVMLRHIMLAGTSNLLGIGAFVLLVRLFAA